GPVQVERLITRGIWSRVHGRSVPLSLGAFRRIRARGVVHGAARSLLAHQIEARFDRGTIDDERQPQRLPTAGGIERVELDVVVGEGLAAGAHLRHDPGGIADVEHRSAEHLPVRVARMRIVRVLDGHRPSLVEAVLDLTRDLLVREVGQEREGALGDSHGWLLRRLPAWARSRAYR